MVVVQNQTPKGSEEKAPLTKKEKTFGSYGEAGVSKPQETQDKAIQEDSAITLGELHTAAFEMKKLQERIKSGEIPISDQKLIQELDFHIAEIEDTLAQELTNKK